MTIGLCPLCLKPGELRVSHIIPNAYFRKMKHERAGKLVSFNSLPQTSVRLSNESWSEEMLCATCEGIFSKLETKCIVSLRKTAREIEEKSAYGSLLHSFNFKILQHFLLSILWRAAQSKTEPFAQVILPSEVAEDIRIALLDQSSSKKIVHIQVSKLHDESRQIAATRFEDMALSPFSKVYGQTLCFTFIFAGYMIKFFFPYIPTKYRRQLGWIRPGPKLFVPTVAMTSIPELMKLMVTGHAKARAGMARF